MDFNKDKRKAFRLQDQKLCEIAKALSHPIRLILIRTIAKLGCCSFSDILNEIKYYAPSTLSQHLKVLRKADLLICGYNGTSSLYSINIIALANYQKNLNASLLRIKTDHFKAI